MIKKGDIILIIVGIVLGFTIPISTTILNQTFADENGDKIVVITTPFVIIYIFLTQISLLLFRTYLTVRGKEEEPSIIPIKGDKEVLVKAEELRDNAKGDVYGIWSLNTHDYKNNLKPYFEKEKLLNQKIHRLINPNMMDHEDLLNHLQNFSDRIISKNYIVTSTNQTGFEILICSKSSKDKQTEAMQLVPNIEGDVDLAIYSTDQNFVSAMKTFYQEMEKNGLTLNIDPDNKLASINNWLNEVKPND